jgi:hypothetical protein
MFKRLAAAHTSAESKLSKASDDIPPPADETPETSGATKKSTKEKAESVPVRGRKRSAATTAVAKQPGKRRTMNVLATPPPTQATPKQVAVVRRASATPVRKPAGAATPADRAILAMQRFSQSTSNHLYSGLQTWILLGRRIQRGTVEAIRVDAAMDLSRSGKH